LFAGVPDYTIEVGSADRITLTLFICFQESKRPSLSNEATHFWLDSGNIELWPDNRIEACFDFGWIVQAGLGSAFCQMSREGMNWR
jgi:hypothetical protein